MVPAENPWIGHVGWCVWCETIQLGDEAVPTPDPEEPGGAAWCCAACENAIWGLRVYSMVAPGDASEADVERARRREVHIGFPTFDGARR